jgi:hypothetical protein
MKRARKNQQKKKKRPERAAESGNRQRFDQLLDDAIFGVKKKNPPG